MLCPPYNLCASAGFRIPARTERAKPYTPSLLRLSSTIRAPSFCASRFGAKHKNLQALALTWGFTYGRAKAQVRGKSPSGFWAPVVNGVPVSRAHFASYHPKPTMRPHAFSAKTPTPIRTARSRRRDRARRRAKAHRAFGLR